MATKFEANLEDFLAYDACSAAHQSRIGTMHGLERFNQEFKRRTRAVRIFPTRAVLLRLVTARWTTILGAGHSYDRAIGRIEEIR